MPFKIYSKNESEWEGEVENLVKGQGYLQINAKGRFNDIPNLNSVDNLNFYGGIYNYATYTIKDYIDLQDLQEYYFLGTKSYMIFDKYNKFYMSHPDLCITMQVSYAGADLVFTPWEEFINENNYYLGRYFKFRLVITNENPDLNCRITKFKIMAYADSHTEGGVVYLEDGKPKVIYNNFNHVSPVLTIRAYDINNNLQTIDYNQDLIQNTAYHVINVVDKPEIVRWEWSIFGY